MSDDGDFLCIWQICNGINGPSVGQDMEVELDIKFGQDYNLSIVQAGSLRNWNKPTIQGGKQFYFVQILLEA